VAARAKRSLRTAVRPERLRVGTRCSDDRDHCLSELGPVSLQQVLEVVAEFDFSVERASDWLLGRCASMSSWLRVLGSRQSVTGWSGSPQRSEAKTNRLDKRHSASVTHFARHSWAKSAVFVALKPSPNYTRSSTAPQEAPPDRRGPGVALDSRSCPGDNRRSVSGAGVGCSYTMPRGPRSARRPETTSNAWPDEVRRTIPTTPFASPEHQNDGIRIQDSTRHRRRM
jgi:hypothetical protein